jgi:hypothetical protein
MKIEFNLLDLDELCLGFMMQKAEDDLGFHNLITLGFLLFNIEISIYEK